MYEWCSPVHRCTSWFRFTSTSQKRATKPFFCCGARGWTHEGRRAFSTPTICVRARIAGRATAGQTRGRALRRQASWFPSALQGCDVLSVRIWHQIYPHTTCRQRDLSVGSRQEQRMHCTSSALLIDIDQPSPGARVYTSGRCSRRLLPRTRKPNQPHHQTSTLIESFTSF